MTSNGNVWKNWLVLGGGSVLLITAFLLTPDPRGFGTHERLFLPPCFFFWLTHIPCPSCGLTTSFAYLAKGHFLKGAQVHPMGPVLFLMLLLMMANALWGLIRNRSPWAVLDHPLFIWAGGFVLSALFLTWIFRVAVHERLLFALRSY